MDIFTSRFDHLQLELQTARHVFRIDFMLTNNYYAYGAN